MIRAIEINVPGLLLFLGVTIIIELIVAYIFGYRKKNELLSIVLVNIITNPSVNFLLFCLGESLSLTTQESLSMLVVSEISVIVIEWLLLRFALRMKGPKLFVLSLVMNVCSEFVGLWAMYLIAVGLAS